MLNASPEDEGLAAALDELDDERIKVIDLVDNAGIAANTNVGIERAQGDYIVFFDHDDTLDPFALLKYAQKIEQDPTLDALYCDEDFLNEEGSTSLRISSLTSISTCFAATTTSRTFLPSVRHMPRS